MFEPTDRPRLFGLEPGVDFSRALAEGVWSRLADAPPEAIARVEIWVNTRRMQRQLKEVFADRPGLLPSIGVLSEFRMELGLKAQSPLARRLSLVTFVSRLIETQPALSAESAAYDLATSLADFFDELAGEGVPFEAIEALDVSDESGHWQRAVAILRAVANHLLPGDGDLSAEALTRLATEAAIARWDAQPPNNPILIAGSTGSRGTTRMLIDAVARLPQGAVILPGYDWHGSAEVWDSLVSDAPTEDHPQHRLAQITHGLGLRRNDVAAWSGVAAPDQARNRLVSLALCPAPVTHFWSTAALGLPEPHEAVQGLTLLEAASPREEANAIALRLREAAELGQTAALITPDRTLTRRVSAQLSRWNIVPDDSAGVPLALTPPGRLFALLRDLPDRLRAEDIIRILKLPLVHSGHDRGPHLLRLQELELAFRRQGPVFPNQVDLQAWAKDRGDDAETWVAWISKTLLSFEPRQFTSVPGYLEQLIELAEGLCAGSAADGSGGLWDEAAGRELRACLAELETESGAVGKLALGDVQAVLTGVVGDRAVRSQTTPHPLIKIWGTLEARVQAADLVILAGLNEAVWPEAPRPDPWLNRSLRKQAGLLLPEREIGLAAHDFQLGMGAKDVWITRSLRSEDTETVPSRWVNRIMNLMAGLPDGGDILQDIRAKAEPYLTWARVVETPDEMIPAASRPSPVPPVDARPKQLSVTQVKTLIRDPYAIYARQVLGLRPLDPLRATPDARLRGTVIHKALERFLAQGPVQDLDDGVERLIRTAELEFETSVAWPSARRLMLGRIARIATDFVADEIERQKRGSIAVIESFGEARVGDLNFTLTAKPDRIDVTPEGTAVVYDYKTGEPPSASQQVLFDKQLLLTSAMAQEGAFSKLGRVRVSDAEFIGLTSQGISNVPAPLESEADVWTEFSTLIKHYLDPDQGYTARRAMERGQDFSDYDSLSRFGEWDLTDDPIKVRLT